MIATSPRGAFLRVSAASRRRDAWSLIVGGAAVASMAVTLFLAVSAGAWRIAAIAGALLLCAIVKTRSVYRNF